jgi:hypothetical protein
MVRLVSAAVVAALALAPSTTAAQPVPPVRLSVATDGTQANGASTLLEVTPNGRHVLFTSGASNLVLGDSNGVADLFVRDRDTDADGVFDEPGAVSTIRVSLGPSIDHIGTGTISRDGRFVLFSTAEPLVGADVNGNSDGYLYDRDTDADGVFDEPGPALSLVTTATGDALAVGGGSTALQITPDGRYVLFTSRATNLQPRATPVTQIYRKDRSTGVTMLVSSTPDGTPADLELPSISAVMRDDGRIVALGGGFQALWPVTVGPVVYPWVIRDLDANTFTPVAAPPKTPTNQTVPVARIAGFSPDGQRVYLSDLLQITGLLGYATGATVEYDLVGNREIRRLPGFQPLGGTAFRDGRSLPLVTSEGFSPTHLLGSFSRFDVVTGRVTRLAGNETFEAAATANRRTLYRPVGLQVQLLDERYGVPVPMPAPVQTGVLDATGGTVFFTSDDATILPGAADTNGTFDVFAVDLLSRLDQDTDGLDDRWEVAMGLDYTSAAGANGAAGDPDTDGQTNLQEQTAGSHPRGTSRQFLAEGAENAFFKTRLGIANPGGTAATAVIRFDGDGGASTSVNVHVPAGSKRTVFVDELAPPSASFSVAVESSAALVSDRTMSWDATEYGAHAERAGPAPATTWFLAEGSTGGFSLFYLLQNAGDTAASVTIRYLRPAPLAPIDRTYSLPPHSRTTVPVNTQAPELAATDVSASITSTQPILVERAMYRTVGSQVFAAGHASAGVTAAATSWFLAEGATGPFFDMFVLLANPGSTAATVEVRYLLTGGTVLTKTYSVAAESRRTIYVDEEDFPGLGRALDNVAVSCAITSTNSVPIVVERAMWFPGPAISPNFWTEAHNSPGVTAAATAWVLADAELGGAKATQTFVLIANTSSTAGQARLTFLPDPGFLGGSLPLPMTIALPANSRTTVPLQTTLGNGDFRFGLLVESVGSAPLADLVVERAMYWNSGGETWAAGTNLLATPVP